MEFKFKKIYNNIDERKEDRIRVMQLYPDKIPLIIEKDPKSILKDIDKNKYLLPDNLSVYQLRLMVQKRIGISFEDKIFFLIKGYILLKDDKISMQDLYEKYKDPQDGFLYIGYTESIKWL